ncbi:MAG: DUF6572 domain-containing protein [Pirellulaceae bacterium]
MSIEQANVIDLIGTDRADGHVTLTIIDHLPWLSDNEHLLLLQTKLNGYLDFIESGQIYDDYPNAIDRDFEISIVCMHKPEGDAIRFLELAGETIRNAGYRFSVQHRPL